MPMTYPSLPSIFQPIEVEQLMQRKAQEDAAAREAANPSKYGRGTYADPEGLAEIYKNLGGKFLSSEYSYTPDIAGVNNAAGQQVAQLLYSMPGAEEGMGGAARLSRQMQGSLPVLQQKQAALSAERQRRQQQQVQQALMALQAYGAAGQEYQGNKNLQLNWDRFTADAEEARKKREDENSFGFWDGLGVIGGVVGTALGGPLGGALGASLFGKLGE